MYGDSMFLCYASHNQKIEDFIDLLAEADDPNDEATQDNLAARVGLTWSWLSDDELRYIEREVAKRWQV